jgi:hypothetical protein
MSDKLPADEKRPVPSPFWRKKLADSPNFFQILRSILAVNLDLEEISQWVGLSSMEQTPFPFHLEMRDGV